MRRQLFCIVSHDRHRDDKVYLFRGTFEKVVKIARNLIFEMRSYDYDEESFEDAIERGKPSLVYYITMMDGDYSVEIYIPNEIRLNRKTQIRRLTK